MKNKIILIYSLIVASNISLTSARDSDNQILERINQLNIDFVMGKPGTGRELLPLVKPLKDKEDIKYLRARETYVELVFSGMYISQDDLKEAIDLFIKLLAVPDSSFDNPLYSKRIEIDDVDLKNGLQMRSNDLRRLLLANKQSQNLEKIEKLKYNLKNDLFKVLTGEISDSDSLSPDEF